MARYDKCIERLSQIAGRQLTDKEVEAVFTRIHKAALDIKAGRTDIQDVTMGPLGGAGKDIRKAGGKDEGNTLIQRAADLATADLEAEAAKTEQRAYLQVLRLGARMGDVDAMEATGTKPLDAVEKTMVRDYTGRVKVESLEQKATGYRDYFNKRLLDTWDALGKDYLGFFQDKEKLLELIKALRGDAGADPLAKKGAEAFHAVAEEARQIFNSNGGSIGKLDDWGMPQHHSQEKVAAAANSADPNANRQAWVDKIMPMLDHNRYVDEITGQTWTDAEIRTFMGKAWDTIATNGHANTKPGQFTGNGSVANRHAESRQIHFKDAQSVIDYWEEFGDRTALEILQGHIDVMAKDVAFVEHFGPNPDTTYQSLRDAALTKATLADPRQTPALEGRAVGLDNLYEYAAGQTKPTYRQWLKSTVDGINHLNSAGKLGGAVLASFFGDKPMMEAVSHMNNLPMIQRWRTELSLLNPLHEADRRLLQREGLMLDSVRSGLQRFYEGLGQGSTTGKLANAVMRVTGMQAINDIRKGSFGLSLMSAIGHEIQAGRDFGTLDKSDVRALRNFGITEADWKVWQLAKLDRLAGVDHVLTSEAISRITDAELQQAGVIAQVPAANEGEGARRNAIVKLLGVVNTESEFAIVTPGWKERAQFYGGEQRGTVKGEIARSFLQFKAFPWAFLQRGMDAVANTDGPTGKALMTAYLVGTTTMAGAMLMQTREVISGRDPLGMIDQNWYKFWAKAFLQGGALGIYGDFLYAANTTRYGSGVLEAVSGPTLGPLLEMSLVLPSAAIRGAIDNKETHTAAKVLGDVKGFIPGGNIWYAKTALDHLLWQRSMEALSPGYLTTIRQKALKDFGQDYWWAPGESTPNRMPDFEPAVRR
ncbi:structural protein [uncultured Caudovirales phage]|uniref:Structural protein n=1 Tax=uncultured Caudovirales phage TaxID=2100421 RepID=A0A6J5T6F0_9CAUD|nr:structural protein [uncultured Caudovirales phage]